MSSNTLQPWAFAAPVAQPVSIKLRGRRWQVVPAERDAMIADIARVAAVTAHPYGLTFRAYAAGGGRYTIGMLLRYGNWAYLCKAAGVECGKRGSRGRAKRGSQSPILRALEPQPDPAPKAPITRDEVLADIVRIHAACGHPRRFPERLYVEAGGRFTGHQMSAFGSWTSLCKAVNLPNGEGPRSQRRKWTKTRLSMTQGEFDAALNRAIGWETPPKGIVRIMRVRPGSKKARPLKRETPALERGAVIVDLCEVAHGLGLSSPRLLNWQTYRDCGGRYTHEQIATLGGFDTLRRAAG